MRALDSLRRAAHWVIALEPIGTVFIRLITMVVVPLVIASVFVGVASLGDVRSLGRIGGKTLGYFVGTTVLAAIVGLVVASVAHVGAGLPQADRDALLGQRRDRRCDVHSAANVRADASSR